MISTRNLAILPKPDSLRRLLQGLALLDAILEEEWQYRYYSYNSKWSDTEKWAPCETALETTFLRFPIPLGVSCEVLTMNQQ